jgi:dTDP-glucose 4,6-dehydratase
VYNIGGEIQVPNIEIVRSILRHLGKPHSLIRHVPDRAGHDRRYAMNIGRLRTELGWTPRHTLEDGLAATVTWYLEHRPWWERVLTEAYRAAAALYLAERP